MLRLPRSEFIRLVRRAYSQLPLDIRRAAENVDIVVEEWPDPESTDLLPEGEGTLFGLYQGVPLTLRGSHSPELPDRIVVYRQPILRNCATRSEVVREVRITLWHEIGHYLGMDEEDLHRLGYG